MNFPSSRRFARDGPVFHLLGLLIVALGAVLVVPAAVALFVGDDPVPYLAPLSVSMSIGLCMAYLFRGGGTIRPAEGLLLITAGWFAGFFVFMVPYFMFGMSFADAFFESASGLTTTGASIMTNIEAWPQSLLLWRSFTQWVGGIAIILMFMLLLPMMGFGGRMLLNNELSGSGEKNYSTTLGNAAKEFMIIYGGLSIAMIALLLILGVNLMDSSCIMLSTISTGGFMCNNGSIRDYNDIVQGIVIVFMFLGATNFYLHYKAINLRSLKVYLRNSEAVCMLVWFVAAAGLICLTVNAVSPSTIEDVFFTVVSIGTTTGFATLDYTTWPAIVLIILVAVAFVGGSSGSTAGGVKVRRLMVLYKYMQGAFKWIVRPRSINELKLDGEYVDRESAVMSIGVLILFLLTICITGIVLMLDGSTASDAFVGGLSLVTSVGPGFGEFGPYGSYANLEDATKVFLSVVMWLGRVEIMMGIVLLTPGFWKEYGASRRRHGRNRLRKILNRT